MKISLCVTHFFNYQRMNVKKKYVAELWIHPQQIPKPFQWHRVNIHQIRGHSGFHVHSFRWNQTEHQEITIYPPVRVFQFCQKLAWSRFSKPLRESCPMKAFQGGQIHTVQNPGKGCDRWNHFQDTKSAKQADARTHGPCLHESWWGSETHAQRQRRPEGYNPGPQERQGSGNCLPAPESGWSTQEIHQWQRDQTWRQDFSNNLRCRQDRC